MKTNKSEQEFEKIKNLFIIDNGKLLSDDILDLLVKNKARMTKDGTTKYAGDFEKLSKKKRERVYIIMDKAFKFIELKETCLFNIDDFIILDRFDKELKQMLVEKQ